MAAFIPNVAALTVASLFYLWRAREQTHRLRERRLRNRVAYMLWVMAGQTENNDSSGCVAG